MTGRDEGPSGPLDVPTLEVLAQRATTHPLVTTWQFRPDALSPRVLELQLDTKRYPSVVHSARIDIRWFVGGDYTVNYLERRENETWQCRWDRHPKPTAPRAHFHPPPDASSAVTNASLEADHHLAVCFAVLEWVETRVQSFDS